MEQTKLLLAIETLKCFHYSCFTYDESPELSVIIHCDSLEFMITDRLCQNRNILIKNPLNSQIHVRRPTKL